MASNQTPVCPGDVGIWAVALHDVAAVGLTGEASIALHSHFGLME